jgi:hypothetical protein
LGAWRAIVQWKCHELPGSRKYGRGGLTYTLER